MTWGLVRAIEAARGSTHGSGPMRQAWGRSSASVDATWVDKDALALEIGAAIVHERARLGYGVQLRTFVSALERVRELGAFDVILVGHVLSELDVGAAYDTRLDEHVNLLRGLIERNLEELRDLVVVEAALRDRTRHLHRIREAMASLVLSAAAPCLHAAPCPALVRDSDWCHEDLAVDLPQWLMPVARAAGRSRHRNPSCFLGRGDPGRPTFSVALGAPPGE